jgi:hypothetical protein
MADLEGRFTNHGRYNYPFGYRTLIELAAPTVEWRLGEDAGTFADTGSVGVTALADIGTVTRNSGSLVNGPTDGYITPDTTPKKAANSSSIAIAQLQSNATTGTLIFWITTPASFTTFDQSVASWSVNVSAGNGYSFGVSNVGKPYYLIRTNSGANELQVHANAAISTSTTYMLAWVADGVGNAILYVNGSSAATTETVKTGTATSGDWTAAPPGFASAVNWWNSIGGRRHGPGPTDDGGHNSYPIDEVAWFDGNQLSAAAINDLWTAGS